MVVVVARKKWFASEGHILVLIHQDRGPWRSAGKWAASEIPPLIEASGTDHHLMLSLSRGFAKSSSYSYKFTKYILMSIRYGNTVTHVRPF